MTGRPEAPSLLPGIALITGGARRIGLAIAEELARRGFALALHQREGSDDYLKTVEAFRARGVKACLLTAELEDEPATRALLAKAAEELGGNVTVLVNNASLFERDEWDTVDRQSWQSHLDANLYAPFILSQEMALRLSETSSGLIVNLIDQRVFNLTPHFVSYTVSKAGLWTLTQTLAQALSPRIRVMGLGPGPTLPSPRQSDAAFKAQWQVTPLERPVDPEEIARAVSFLIDTPSLTGQMIALDSGQHLGWRPGRGAEDE